MRNVIICLALIGMLRCTEREGTHIVISKDSLNRIVSEIQYLNDTLKHGLAKYYYENGDIKDEVEYAYDKREGWHKHYKPGKILENEIQFKNGLQHGKCYWYYDNGKLKSLSYWINDREYGSTFLHYPNGKLETYRCKDFFDNTVYIVKWDEQGNKLREEGLVFSPEFYVNNLDSANTLRANQNVTIEITVAEPPETKSTIWMGELTGGGIKNFRELPIENNLGVYKHTYTKPGNYRWVTIGEIKNKHGDILKRDSVVTDFIVR